MQADGLVRLLGTMLGFLALSAVGIASVLTGETLLMSVIKGIAAFIALSVIIGFFGGLVINSVVSEQDQQSEVAIEEGEAGVEQRAA